MTSDVPPSLVIRAATAADLPQIGTLAALLVQSHHEFDPARFFPATGSTPQHYARFLGSQLDDADAVFLVADAGGRVIGYVYAALEGYDYMALRGPAGVIHDLIVDPAHRSHGVGRQLLNAALDQLTSRGAPRVVLFTAQQNHPAQRLFSQLGFRPTMIEMTRESTVRTSERTERTEGTGSHGGTE
jgi:ribosomal protein S18 acetylase RimI-like enzyme